MQKVICIQVVEWGSNDPVFVFRSLIIFR